MVPVLSLWLPILLSAVGVFILSSLIHMVLGYHKNDYAALPNEAAVMDALRSQNIPPGEYMMPKPVSMEEMKTEAFKERWQRGPVGMINIMPNVSFGMGRQLAGWFVYCLVISIFAGYVASRALAPGADYLQVFRFASVTAFLGYAAAVWQQTIWYRHSMATTLRTTFDGLLFALVTGGFFGWLWP